MTVNDPAVVASLLGLVALGLTALLALGSMFYRFGRLMGQVESLRHDQTRRYGEYIRQSKERYDGIVHRLERLESHFIARASGDGD